jgi:hypothetical protein
MHHLHREAASKLPQATSGGQLIWERSEAAFLECTLDLGQRLHRIKEQLESSGLEPKIKARLLEEAIALPAAGAPQVASRDE